MRDKDVLNNIENLLKNRKNINIDTILLYSLINKNMKDVDKILEIDDEHTLHLKASELKKFLTDFKISNEILSEMISNNIDRDEIEKIRNDYKINVNIENVKQKETPAIRTLLGYDNLLKKEIDLVDSNLTDFLEFVEKGDANNASFVYEELTTKQRASIPDDITLWLAVSSQYG